MGEIVYEPLEGIAFLKYASAQLLNADAKIYRVYDGPEYDPVLHNVSVYNDDWGGWQDLACRFPPPPCPGGGGTSCKYRKDVSNAYYATCRPTALRIEVAPPTPRCGYKLKDGHIGGSFTDYGFCNA